MHTQILLIEARAELGDALQRRLRARGYTVSWRREARALREQPAAAPFELVILSLDLPGEDPLALCQTLRQRPEAALLPILLLGTGHEAIRSRAQAIAAGADDFLLKPSQLNLLIQRVSQLLGPSAEAPPAEAAALLRFPGAAAQPQDTAAQPSATAPQPAPHTHDTAAPAPQPSATAAPPSATAPQPAPHAHDTAAPAPAPRPHATAAPPSATAAPPSATAPQPAPHAHDTAAPAPRPHVTSAPLAAHFEATSAPDARLDALTAALAEDHEALHTGQRSALAQRGLPELLSDLWLRRFTGRLEIAAAGVLRRVFFEQGQPTAFESSSAHEDLCSALAAEGLISRAQLKQVRARASVLQQPADQLLIDSGLVDAEAIWRILHEHVRQRLLQLFSLEVGESTLIEGGPRPLDPIDLGEPPGRLILDGVRQKYGRLRLYRAFAPPAVVPTPQTDARRPADHLPLRADEENVLLACDGQRSAAEIARIAQLDELDTLAILYAFSLIGLIEAPHRFSAQPVGLPALSEAHLRRAQPARTADELPGYAELVGAKLAQVQTADYFHILGIARTAGGAEVQAAAALLKRRFDPHRVRRESPLWPQVREIAQVLDDAERMLRDERLRALYETATRLPASPLEAARSS